MSKKGSITHQIVTECPGLQPGTAKASKNTIVQHKHNAIKFGKWCKEHCGCRSYKDISDHIVENLNRYSQWLESEGKTPATIHTYIAGCCAVMAASVFHLSHWRCDVTIDNYLLAR